MLHYNHSSSLLFNNSIQFSPQQQSDLQISSEAMPSAQKMWYLLQLTIPLSLQEDLYAGSQANTQSFSSATSDDLLSELENSAEDLDFLSSSSWSDQTSHQIESTTNRNQQFYLHHLFWPHWNYNQWKRSSRKWCSHTQGASNCSSTLGEKSWLKTA